MKTDKHRLFVGIAFDQEFWNGIKGIFKILDKKHWHVKFEPREKLHITLLFLGEVDAAILKQLHDMLGEETRLIPPFTLTIKGLGAFPILLLPVVIWLGLRGDLQSLYRMRKALEKKMDALKIDYDRKPYQPHVTLGRLERNTSRKERLEIGRQLMKMRVLDVPQKLLVDRLYLYESRLDALGSRYDVLGEFEFGGTIPSDINS